MPEVDGLDLLRFVRSNSALADLPVISECTAAATFATMLAVVHHTPCMPACLPLHMWSCRFTAAVA